MKALRITGIVELVEITNDLRALQHAVGGYIETIGLRDGGVMIVDEEGMLKAKPQNPLAGLIAGTMIYGVALIVGTDEDEFDDVPENYMELLRLNDELA